MDRDQSIPAEELDLEDQVDGNEDGTTEIDGDFEFDENGDIIIPEEVGETAEEGEEGEGAEESTDVEETESKEGENGTEAEAGETATEEEEPPSVAALKKEIEMLRERNRRLETQSKDTLDKLGVRGEDDPLKGLAKVAAEAKDQPLDEYLKDQELAHAQASAAEQVRRQRNEEVYRTDLAEIQAQYPETRVYKHLQDMPEKVWTKFAECRRLGLPAKSAYAAANPDGIRTAAAKSAQRQSLHDSKSHLRSSVPVTSKETGTIRMPKSELASWRDMFPNKSDKEIMALYKNTANKE